MSITHAHTSLTYSVQAGQYYSTANPPRTFSDTSIMFHINLITLRQTQASHSKHIGLQLNWLAQKGMHVLLVLIRNCGKGQWH